MQERGRFVADARATRRDRALLDFRAASVPPNAVMRMPHRPPHNRRVAARAQRARVAALPARRAGRRDALRLRGARRRASRSSPARFAAAGLAAGRPRRARLAQRAGVRRGAVRLLVGGARRACRSTRSCIRGSSRSCSRQRRALGVRRCGIGRRRSAACGRCADARARRRASAAPSTNAAARPALAAAPAPCAPRRSGVALLHERHDRTAEGRGDLARQPARDERMPSCRDVEAVAPGDAILHPAPLSHGSGLYVLPHVLARRGQRRAGIGRLRCRRDLSRCSTRWDRACFFARADDGEAARRRARDRRRAARSAEVHRLRRRADVRRRLQGGVRGARSAARADLRPGRVADDDHRDEPRAARRCDRARRRCAPRLGRRRADRHRAAHRRRRRRARCRRARSARSWCAGRR